MVANVCLNICGVIFISSPILYGKFLNINLTDCSSKCDTPSFPTNKYSSLVSLYVFIYVSSNFRVSLFPKYIVRSEEHTSELQSRFDLVCRLLLEKKKHNINNDDICKRLGNA